MIKFLLLSIVFFVIVFLVACVFRLLLAILRLGPQNRYYAKLFGSSSAKNVTIVNYFGLGTENHYYTKLFGP